jgi:hypothetical protein
VFNPIGRPTIFDRIQLIRRSSVYFPLENGIGELMPIRPKDGFGSNLTVLSQSYERPESALSCRYAFVRRMALVAPHLPLARGVGTGSVGWF